MQLTKYAHATVLLTKDTESILLDPGKFTPNAAELVDATDAILITHDHFDHFDYEAITEGLKKNAKLHVYAPQSVADKLEGFDDQFTIVKDGDTFETAGFKVGVFGEQHAVIHDDMPFTSNVAYFIDGKVFAPGDSYFTPGVEVDTLLVPTSGPWTKTGHAIEFIRAIKPRQGIQIHDAMLSDIGKESMGAFLGKDSLSKTPLITLDEGESVTI